MSTIIRKQSIIALAFALGLAAALSIAFGSTSTAWADSDSFKPVLNKPPKTIQLLDYPNADRTPQKVLMGDGSSKKVTDVKCSNKKVINPKKYYDSSYGAYIIINVLKAGKATLSYKYKGKTHKIKVIIKDYKNPLKTFKIGSNNFLSSFNNDSFYSTSLKSGGKLTVKAKSGWRITEMKKHTNSASNVNVKNGSKIGTNTTAVLITVVNKKTKDELILGLYTNFE